MENWTLDPVPFQSPHSTIAISYSSYLLSLYKLSLHQEWIPSLFHHLISITPQETKRHFLKKAFPNAQIWLGLPTTDSVLPSTFTLQHFSSVQFSSVAQSCPTLCDPMNCSTPGLPVHHQLPEFTLTHIHRVSDAIQPSHSLSSPSPPAPNPSQHQSLFQWVNSSHEVAKVLEFQLQHHSFQSNPKADLQNGLVGSPCCPRDSQESSPTPLKKKTTTRLELQSSLNWINYFELLKILKSNHPVIEKWKLKV